MAQSVAVSHDEQPVLRSGQRHIESPDVGQEAQIPVSVVSYTTVNNYAALLSLKRVHSVNTQVECRHVPLLALPTFLK